MSFYIHYAKKHTAKFCYFKDYAFLCGVQISKRYEAAK